MPRSCFGAHGIFQAADLFDGGAHMVGLARRHTARCDDEIMIVGGGCDGGLQCGRVVAQDAEVGHLGTELRQQATQQLSVGIVDSCDRPRVAGLTLKEIRDIYRARANLLELIAQDIVRGASDAEIGALLAMIRAMRVAVKAGDVRAFFWANVDFHELNTELGGNRIVKKIIDSLLLRTLRLRLIGLSQPGRMQKSFVEHERLCRAYADRDANLAAALIRTNHINGLAVQEALYAPRDGSSHPATAEHEAMGQAVAAARQHRELRR